MFTIDKSFRDLESELGDEQDAKERMRKEAETYKKKY